MNIAICTNWNGIGLQREGELLDVLLTEWGHTVARFQYDDASLPEGTPKFDLAIYLEVVPRQMLALADTRWAFLNPEWCKPLIIEMVAKYVDKVLTKTHEAQRIFEKLFPGKTFYTGFMARDQFDSTVMREPKFLHIGGNSSLRGTETVLDAWKWKRNGESIGAKLTIVSSALKERPEIEGVTYVERATEEELKRLQNSHAYHIYPSGTEGYGHAMHEALSVGASLIATNAPPMSELFPVDKPIEGILVTTCGTTKYNLATVYEVSARNIWIVVSTMMQTLPFIWAVVKRNRAVFLRDNERFKQLLRTHIDEFTPRQAAAPRVIRHDVPKHIAFIGNFGASESTENMIKWALTEGLGHRVDMLQENDVTMKDISAAMVHNDALLWVRTPGWLKTSNHAMLEFLEALDVAGIPTLSVHLDKFWGIPDREALIGVHPFWCTKHVFTADGSRQTDFAALDVNHHFMRPAVSEVYCHPGTPQEEYRCDVGFVGAKDYHGEYPFRRKMVEFLETKYGPSFKHITGLRGHGLNDFYASCKVVVGDCIFAGTPNYWSDRLPETCGRHGFLLHPQITGIDVPLVTYKPQDLDDLAAKVDYWIPREAERRLKVLQSAEHIRRHDTWTVRMAEILAKVYE